MRKRTNPSFWLYAISFYILLQFCWWAWLLIDQSQSLADYAVFDGANYNFQSKVWMVLGEGAVFISLLAFGIFKLKKSIDREVSLAHAQRNFLLTITHELNTPIATAKLYMETLFKRDLEKEKQKEIIGKSVLAIDRLESMVSNVLTSARIEEEQLVLHPKKQSLSNLVENFTKTFKEDRTNRLELDLVSEGKCNVDELAIQSILSNLIDNAFKYDKEGNIIQVCVSENETHVCLEVKDLGIGISEENKNSVFEKFYRVQSEDTRTTKGTGLGLFIVSTLVKLQEGSISIHRNEPKGSVFKVNFPKAS